MPIVEYKNIKDKDGISKPGYICEGNKHMCQDDHSMIGWVNANPKYWVPSGLKRLSKEEFVERCKKKCDYWEGITDEEKEAIIADRGEDYWEQRYDALTRDWTQMYGE